MVRPGDWYHVGPGVEHGARYEPDTADNEFWVADHGSDD
jgi:hypothetical protein